MHLNLDRRTGYVKGYAFIEYASIDEAQTAVLEGDGHELLGKIVSVDFAIVEPSKKHGKWKAGAMKRKGRLASTGASKVERIPIQTSTKSDKGRINRQLKTDRRLHKMMPMAELLRRYDDDGPSRLPDVEDQDTSGIKMNKTTK